MYLYFSNEFTTGYTVFNFIRLIFRVIALVEDCTVMNAAIAAIDPSNPTFLQFRVETLLKSTTGLCVLCWVSKWLALFSIECFGWWDSEMISDRLSFLTLWIGEIPKTACHLLIVYKHTKSIYPNYKHGFGVGFLCIYKLVERGWGTEEEYDWRKNVWSGTMNNFYVWGIILETLAALLSIALAFI